MPTFRNDTRRVIDHWCLIQHPTEPVQKVLIRFDPGKLVKLKFWVPYAELGLTLVNANQPKCPNTILVSGTYDFAQNVERRFNIEPCDTYIVNIIVQKGGVMLYPGDTAGGVEITQDTDVPFHYRAVFDWEFAPYIRIKGMAAETRATVHAEVDRSATMMKKIGVRSVGGM